ncbi:MAG TPA: GGDEF domain-containing protein [Gammaproteobacteria bacterium]|nr:GGDEF domain-containing protein [Gammaproteobacteria bacterium]
MLSNSIGRELGKIARHVALCAAVLALALALLPSVADATSTIHEVADYSAYGILGVALVMAWHFNRSHPALIAAVLILFHWVAVGLPRQPLADPRLADVAWDACGLLVPLVFVVLALFRDRGVANVHAALRAAFIVGLALCLLLPALFATPRFERWMDYPLLAGVPLPGGAHQPVVAAQFLAGLVLAGRVIRFRTLLDTALLGALVAVALSVYFHGVSGSSGVLTGAGGLLLWLGVVQDSHVMAFQDELTELPSRRAMNERLMGLGRRYTLAMVDVDHFKLFNDRFGHDVGDQALRFIAAHLRRVGGGGTVYRYGGEEFAVVFAGKDLDAVLPHLQSLRARIASSHMAIRQQERRDKHGRRTRGRNGRRPRPMTVRFTVSIGAAERTGGLDKPAEVLGAADRALYRAKKRGRNRVMT